MSKFITSFIDIQYQLRIFYSQGDPFGEPVSEDQLYVKVQWGKGTKEKGISFIHIIIILDHIVIYFVALM